ncbi:MAG TPA: methylenetetrahydrofolate reductase [Acidimicrobiales bacterium]|nr:methylenetetrahydrofolate reductase [Acidimicrobiales bacterium]
MTRISELLARRTCFSVELWPPRTEAAQARLEQVLAELAPLDIAFTSITYGAGGSTRDRTHELVVRILRSGTTTPMAHLTCAAHRRQELEDILARYRREGIENILAIHGDPPLDSPEGLAEGELAHAIDLVRLAKQVGDFCVAVAAHPEGHPRSPDLASDRRHLAEKLAEADFAITQFFFRVEDYLGMVDALHALGVDKPVVPGIMPITNYRTVSRMAQMSGTKLPGPLAARIEAVADRPEELRRIGVEVACELGAKLLAEGVPGLHVYTMNQAAATLEIYANLGLGRPGRPAPPT